MSDVYQTIYNLLVEENINGKTQSEKSRESGVARSRICRLLDSRNGIENIRRLGLGTFFKLFPRARIIFDGDDKHSMGNVHHSQDSTIVQGRHVSIGGNGGESAASLLRRIMASHDLDAETKVKLYNIAQEKQG